MKGSFKGLRLVLKVPPWVEGSLAGSFKGSVRFCKGKMRLLGLQGCRAGHLPNSPAALLPPSNKSYIPLTSPNRILAKSEPMSHDGICEDEGFLIPYREDHVILGHNQGSVVLTLFFEL